jgi:type III pantothenate kinase
MLLAVDCGNTNVVFALFDRRAGPSLGAAKIRARWRIASDSRRTADEYAVWLLQLLAIEGIERSAVTAMIVSSVVPRARHNLEVLGEK